ncbi:LytTR family DNA-binding domain-containing protein [Mariniflexile litorale]|uniref:LytTR family DNA-binding domain-containing protein n=1 Tax=Mariniflexile litorale TaxID=3045158 RepID=A0AAU7EFN4_9FLAO|nr:LytTR family DNA-binding domain-containing protein [Mariniflexile sp. KMM 9835]MDQ8211651.1 LytTR family DNA-binding domain-containing protein [Mariniflexile sp. KMM 9835]
MKLIKAIIIDEDVSTIASLNQFALENHLIISISGSSENIISGLELIKTHKPELIFLNPTEKNLSDINYINELAFHKPKFVFVSSEKERAFEAFKHKAIDFLLKPLPSNDIILSIYKVSNYIEMEMTFQNQKIKDLNSLNSLYLNSDYLSVAFIDKIELIKKEDIIFCKAEGKYTEFHLVNGFRILSSKNLGEYQDVLGDKNFYRIHHSYIINIKHIIKITKKDGYYCEFSNNVKLPIAKRRQEGFSKFINL